MQDAFGTITQARAAARHDEFLSAWLRDLVWPNSVWSMELLVAAAEMGFEALPAAIVQEVEEYSLGPSSTKPIEDLFNSIRKMLKRSGNGSVTGELLWHQSLTASVLPDADLAPTKPEPVDEIESSMADDELTLPAPLFCGNPRVLPW